MHQIEIRNQKSMAIVPKYKQFISEFVRQQITVLGPQIAVSTANRTEGLQVDHRGSVTELQGDPLLVLKGMLNEFNKLMPQLTSYFVQGFFTKYPDIAEEYGEPIGKSNFHCALKQSKEIKKP